VSPNRPVRMFESLAVAFAIVTAFLVDTVTPGGEPHTTRKDCPSGAAANVSHNRPVRMFERGTVEFAIVTAFVVGIIALGDRAHTIRKDCPSGGAANVSHNRLVLMSERWPPDLSTGVLLEGGIDMVAANPAPLQSHGINRG